MTAILNAIAPWIGYFVADYDSTSAAMWTLRGKKEAANVFIGTLRGHRMRRREGVFDQFGALLQFPRYFGENWNAFVDCVEDLDWLRVGGALIVILDAAEVLADGELDEFELLCKVLAEAGQSWATADEFRGGGLFRVLLHATAEQSVQLRAKLAAVRREIPLIAFPFSEL